MGESLFQDYVAKWFPGVVTKVVATLNGTERIEQYYHKKYLTKEYSVTGRWESMSINNTLVMADVIALDSNIPLKRRDSIAKFNGDIPKQGMEMKLNENELRDLRILIKTDNAETNIVNRLFRDTIKCIGGIWERNEFAFLQALSYGVCVVEDANNVGSGVRLQYAIPTGNKFGVSILWSNAANARPLDDIARVKEAARRNGHTLTKVMMDYTAFNNMVATTQFKERYSWSLNNNSGILMVPDFEQARTLVRNQFRIEIEVIERTVVVEKNGIQTALTPWKDGAVTFVTTDDLGIISWTDLAEKFAPVPGVSYETADDFILVSKFRNNKPSLAEFTNSQAAVIPVLGGIERLYQLDSKTVQA